MRSLLFVPADSERKLARGPQSGADALILDLEDSVVPANRPLARRHGARFPRLDAGPPGSAAMCASTRWRAGLALDDLAAVVAGQARRNPVAEMRAGGSADA